MTQMAADRLPQLEGHSRTGFYNLHGNIQGSADMWVFRESVFFMKIAPILLCLVPHLNCGQPA
jgi:hypothetical protein